tara:strand:+ start:261 stop:497 length:237 start_codon:yes stop_codon:yes gene_type:complete
MADELRAEAERLVDLDDRGLLIEAVTACLRVGEQSSRTMESLHALDMAMVDWVRGDTNDGEPPTPRVHDGSGGDGGIG